MQKIYKVIRYFIEPFMIVGTLLFWCIVVVFKRKKAKAGVKPRLVWGPTPLINNKYYSWALQQYGYHSKTFMSYFYGAINNKKDFDLYYLDFLPFKVQHPLLVKVFSKLILPYICFCYAIVKFDIFHHSFLGGFLGETLLRRWEAFLLKSVGCKIVILGYGADFYRYSKIYNLSWRYGVLVHYPEQAIKETLIEDRVMYWCKYADAIINGMQIDHLGRWDALPFRAEVINMEDWTSKPSYSSSNGKNKAVKILHAPNHRYIKGTEYLTQAIEELKNEGLQIELILVEKKPNSEIKRLLQEEVDILFDQLIFGYAMSTIEGLASGVSIISNLENERYTRVFRRYSYLNECPILSASHENLKENLRTLITNPKLRQELGEAGRKYAEKYHSKEAAHYLFGNLYKKIWHKEEGIDLLNLYHPLLSEYNKQEQVQHPLVENKLPLEYFTTC